MQGHDRLRLRRKSLLASLSLVTELVERLRLALGTFDRQAVDKIRKKTILQSFKVVIDGAEFLDVFEDIIKT